MLQFNDVCDTGQLRVIMNNFRESGEQPLRFSDEASTDERRRRESKIRVLVNTSQIDAAQHKDQSKPGAAAPNLHSSGLSGHDNRNGDTGARRVLGSWKEIACYLGKGVRTVQRWERKHGLPVRRPLGHSRIVLAYPEDLERWMGPAASK